MKKLELQRAKGVRDFGPAEKIVRDRVIDTFRTVFGLYGFLPIETPVLERYDLLASKFGGGEQSDLMKETFTLKDQGERQLALRNEFTVPLARFVGMNPNLRMPFKRYQIGQIFRDGPMKTGRYREFWQCDVDIVGVAGSLADVELIMVAQDVFERLGLNVTIKINNRQIVNALLTACGVNQDEQTAVLIAIDKLDKVGKSGVQKELADQKIEIKNSDLLFQFLDIAVSNDEIINKLKAVLKDDVSVTDLEKMLKKLPSTKNVQVTPSLVRGQAYYTGLVLEVFLTDATKLSSALAGGGRYDDMIGGFLGGEQVIPAIGIGFGLDTIMDALEATDKLVAGDAGVDVYIISMGEEIFPAALKVAGQFRLNGVRVAMDLENRKMKKNIEYAVASGINWLVVMGENEVESNTITLKDLRTGVQKVCTFEDALIWLQSK